MQKNPTINGALAGMFKDFIKEKKLDIPLCDAYLDHWKVDNRVSVVELGLCLLSISQQYPIHKLGIEISQYFQPTYSGLLGYLLLPCHNLNEAFLQFKKYYALMWDGFNVDVIETDNEITISWDVPQLKPYKNHEQLNEIVRVGYELGISCFIKTAQQLVKNPESFQPKQIFLPGAIPLHQEDYETFFKCKVDFCHETGSVVFDKAVLNQPINLNNDFFNNLLFKQAEAQLKSISELKGVVQNDFLVSVQKILEQGLHAGSPTLEYVANRMSISKSTLQNKLATHDLNFQHVLDSMRFELAKMYMQDSSLSLIDISGLLAFSEQSAFNRYFKRLSGFSPHKYRKLFLSAPHN